MIRPTLLLLFTAATLGAQPPARAKRVAPPAETPAPRAPLIDHARELLLAHEAPGVFELLTPLADLLPDMRHAPVPGLEPLLHLAPSPELAPAPRLAPLPEMPSHDFRPTERAPFAFEWADTPMPPGMLHWREPALTLATDDFLRQRPPQSWAPQDPADSLYRRARELLNRGEYRLAAAAFRDIHQRYPTSEYASSAHYYQAFALYRIGGNTELRQALESLDAQRAKYRNTKIESDVATLQARILGALSSRGDATAQRQLAQIGQPGQRCEVDEDQGVRVEALRALYQNDPETVGPLVQQVLNRRDECSVSLRRSAVYIIGNRRDQSASSILANVARTDPSMDVRVEAISFLGRVGDDAGLEVLEELLRTSNEERIQRAAVRALANHPNSRALQRVRALVERTDAPERLRAEAIGTFDRERVTTEEVAWLRALYPRLDQVSLKQRTVHVIARVGGAENEAWLQTILRNDDEPSVVRAAILSRLGQTMAIADLGRMYDGASSRTVREYIISALGRRTEDEATDKLIDIVKTGTDPSLRRSAISALTRKKDPRSNKLLLDLISQ